jgi:diguanylate cyclase (GGDEF)-like protein/PAS domain S-box-containing protein
MSITPQRPAALPRTGGWRQRLPVLAVGGVGVLLSLLAYRSFPQGYPLGWLLSGLGLTGAVTLLLFNGVRQTHRAAALAAALEATNQRLNQAQQIGRIGNWELDLRSRRLWWSDEIFRIFELDPQRFGATYENFLNAVHPEDREQVNRAYRESLASGIPYDIVHRLQMADGRVKHVRERCETWFDDTGQPLRSSGTVQDITDRQLAEQALRESEARFRLVFEQAAGGIAFADGQGTLMMVNEAFCRLLGYPPERLRGMNFAEFTHPDDLPREFACFEEIVAGKRESYRLEKRYLHPQGAPLWVDVSVAVSRDGQGRPVSFVGIAFDISARKQIERLLEESRLRYEEAEERLRLFAKVFENSGEAILITDPQARILDVNQAFTRLTGYDLEEVRGQNPRLLSSGREGAPFFAEMWRRLGEEGSWQGEVWDRRKDGEVYPKWLNINALRNERGEITHYIGSFIDISQIKNAEASIRFLAHHDPLTGLPNRFTLQARLGQTLADARRFSHGVAVLFIDLDRFKTINDSLGHQVGDQLLIEVARRLGQALRETDTVARLGGDEFVIVLPHITHLIDVVKIARTLVRNVSQPVRLGELLLHTSPSIGVSLFPSDGEDGETLLKNADTAMYHAKAQGRATYQFFKPEMNEAVQERLSLENDLRLALERGEFYLHLQPQFQLAGGELAGLEALIRWRHPERGMVSPGKFIPVAEEAGLILPIGEWVLQEACRLARAWQQQGLLRVPVAVNVSARQFRQRGFAGDGAADPRPEPAPPELLELEITESAVMEAEGGAVSILQRLHDMGLQLAIDDFGTGYSSLNYLKSFPLHKLKIDQSFVRDLEHDPNDAAISLAIIGLAHNLGLRVIAEGIETEAQLQLLRGHGCGQGFLLGRGGPAAETEALLRQHQRGHPSLTAGAVTPPPGPPG